MPTAVLDRAFFRDLFRQIEEIDQLGQHIIEHPKTGMLMVLVPAGKLIFDTDEVDLPAYYVAVHPVTNAQYARFVAETGHREPDRAEWGTPVWSSGTFRPEEADHPVVCVNFDDAKAYCSWAGLRLPTQHEWAAATIGLDDREYMWGDNGNLNRCRNHSLRGKTTEGVWHYAKGGTPLGGLQFSGNVWEWCGGVFSNVVARGGAWWLDDRRVTSSFRRTVGPNTFLASINGFRCVHGLDASL